MSATSTKRALLIVEQNFMEVHVGVRRVIFFYWRKLARAGFEVRLAFPRGGSLCLAAPIHHQTLVAHSHGSLLAVPPCWTSANPTYIEQPPERRSTSSDLRWSDAKTSAGDYDVSIVTAPWLSDHGLPAARYTAGIIYDMVPNLVACGALSFETPLDTFKFAREHDLGNKFYMEHCDSIFAISESTRHDFISFYSMSDPECVRTIIPFEAESPGLSLFGRNRKKLPRTPHVILVNALDPRKNFSGASASLKLMKREVNLRITIVGRERALSRGAALELLDTLRQMDADIAWYANPGDYQLNALYRNADLLLFPSFYEGLGLPILEAQGHGVPVVSADTSSCGEINMNKALCVDAYDPVALAAAALGTLDRSLDHKRGRQLVTELAVNLSGKNQIPLVL